MKKPKIGVVTVNWHSIDFTHAFLLMLKKQTYSNIYTVIVNNEPLENSQMQLLQGANIKVVNTDFNYGYAGGLNRGIKVLQQFEDIEFILLTNNDVSWPADFLENMVNSYKSNTIVSPVIVYASSGRVQNTGGRIVYLLGGTINLNKNLEVKTLKKTSPDFLSGCCLFMSRDVLNKVGLFDEAYGSYFEDVDYCLRAKSKGVKLVINWNLAIKHFHSASTRNFSEYKTILLSRNALLFARKNLTTPSKQIFIVSHILFNFLIKLKHPKAQKSFWQGVKEGLTC